MVQNRNKLINLFIGNIAAAIVHEILEEAINDENLRWYYDKEFQNSFSIAKRYREKINPAGKPLGIKDQNQIKNKVIAKVRNELIARIEKGYKGIDLDKIAPYTEEILKKLKIE